MAETLKEVLLKVLDKNLQSILKVYPAESKRQKLKCSEPWQG